MKKTTGTRFWGIVAIPLALLAGCNKPPETVVNAPQSTSTTANVTDADITTNVTTALLQEPVLKGFDISVVTLKGDVRMIGAVDNQSQIDAATKVARGIDGVHAIHDELTIKK